MIEAYRFFRALALSQASSTSSPDCIASALSDYCEFKLEDHAAAPPEQPNHSVTCSDISPVGHLTQALSLDATAASPLPARSDASRRKLNAQAAGQAIAYLLHPALTSQILPITFREEAKRVFSRRISSSIEAFEVPASVAAQNAKALELMFWTWTATRSVVLAQLLKMTGLYAIKKEMFSIFDEVSTGTARKFAVNLGGCMSCIICFSWHSCDVLQHALRTANYNQTPFKNLIVIVVQYFFSLFVVCWLSMCGIRQISD